MRSGSRPPIENENNTRGKLNLDLRSSVSRRRIGAETSPAVATFAPIRCTDAPLDARPTTRPLKLPFSRGLAALVLHHLHGP